MREPNRIELTNTDHDARRDSPIMPLAHGQITELLARHISDGVVIQDLKGRILWSNAAFTRITGFTAEEIRGRRPQEFIIPPEARPSAEEIANFQYDPKRGAFQGYEIVQNIRKSGELFWVQLSFGLVDTPDGSLVVVTTRDVSTQIETEEQLRRATVDLEAAVLSDPLTGLANRRRVSAALDEALSAASASGGRVAVFHVDLDSFKAVNDTHGHAAGDAVLVQTAAAMRRIAEPSDLVARIGGDEFLILRPDALCDQDVAEFARRIAEAVRAPVLWRGAELQVSASIGTAFSDDPRIDADALIRNADFALYESKRDEHRPYVLYDAPLRATHRRRKALAADLRRAIARDELTYFYQPIVRLTDGRMVGFETLARWRRPDHGMLTPDDFVPIANDLGLVRDLDLSALRAGAETLAALRDATGLDLRMSFNASTRTLAAGDLADRMAWEAERLDLPRRAVTVEVLETVFLGGKTEADVVREIDRIASAGFPTYLDDFGTGYAGLATLARARLTGIKIDRVLVETMLTDPTSAAIVRSTARLAADLGLEAVAEGVEDAETAAMLSGAGCPSAQGYAYARPMPARDLLAWAERFHATEPSHPTAIRAHSG